MNDLNKSNDLLFITKEDPRPLLKEGIYEVQYHSHKLDKFFGGYKLYVNFQVCSLSEDKTELIFKAYNYYDKLPTGSSLYKDFTLLHGAKIRKNSSLTMKLFKNKILAVRVRTVSLNRKQLKLTECLQYSVVDEIINIVAGS